MSGSEKLRITNRYLNKLLSIAENSIKLDKYELSYEALVAFCNIQYRINQVYSDDKAEKLLLKLSEKTVSIANTYIANPNTVLFYDGFGLDLRGWAVSYVRAIIRNGYELVYVTNNKRKDSIPHILKEMEGTSARKCFIDISSDQIKWVRELNEVFEKYRPRCAFFYTTPNDVAATAVFDAYKGKVMRFQIDLTDHAFWIGVNATDYYLESRIPGVSNAIYGRNIPKNRIIRFDGCLYINRDTDTTPLPFDIVGRRYIFSGGALYKTHGDKDHLFYKIIDRILEQNTEISFLYAGDGDTSELVRLQDKYPERVYHIGERKDFYRLIENCEFMWNTYPMFGGLMMRFSANAGRVPLTLKHGKDHEGLLNNQSELGIEFDTPEEIICEAQKLLTDNEYKKHKENRLKGAVLSEDEFAENLKKIIDEQKSNYRFDDITYVNTDDFRQTYLDRLDDPEYVLSKCIICKQNTRLFPLFPGLVIKRVTGRLFGGDIHND